MLILTRRIGEILKIGDDIEVTVLSINGQQIRLGVEAPHRRLFQYTGRKSTSESSWKRPDSLSHTLLRQA